MENLSFRTPIKIKPEENKIDFKSKIILFGSCFSENIGNKFRYFKFDEITNPYGVLFNPVAIENAINDCIHCKTYTKKDLFFQNEQWHSYNHHSDFSSMDVNHILSKINGNIQEIHQQLQNTTHLIITLGTAWVYQHIKTDKIVANCHKVPQKEFHKKLLSVNDIRKKLTSIKNNIFSLNPSINIIFTVSPVRHLKDGMVENSISKAHLLTAIHDTLDKNTNYFPSYEIVLDDLRDYRFYEKDMVHPNETAIEYIWNIFKNTWITGKTEKILKEIDVIQKGLLHRPFNPNSDAHKKFKANLLIKIKNLKDSSDIIF